MDKNDFNVWKKEEERKKERESYLCMYVTHTYTTMEKNTDRNRIFNFSFLGKCRYYKIDGSSNYKLILILKYTSNIIILIPS